MVTTWSEEIPAGIISMHRFLFRSEEYSISYREHGTNVEYLVDAFVRLRLNNRFGEHGVDREFCHSSSQFGQVSFIIESP